MGKITDRDVMSATANGDGTHSGVRLAQWLYEATTGRPLAEDEAKALLAEGVRRARERQSREGRG